ncbi:MAG: P-loop containing nucleoside triphosphate hydrolase protein [Benniella sp.]|nr:MAG: P-loop containing nucleoside triphosphate hydrolase protein [Benniella sp.]
MLLAFDLARTGRITAKCRRISWQAKSASTLRGHYAYSFHNKIARLQPVSLLTLEASFATSLLRCPPRYDLPGICVPALSTVRYMGTLKQSSIAANSPIPLGKATEAALEPLSSSEYSRPFTDLTNLQPSTLEAIQSTFGYDYMSKVQSRVLSVIPTTRDLLVKARTGTGKTLAFLVAALESVMALPDRGETFKHGGGIGCVIVAPTRELALQISDEASKLLNPLGWGVQYLVGGESRTRQLDRVMKEGAGFVVATPGRLQDLLDNADFAAKVAKSKVLVLDEADTMLELGFRTELDSILNAMPQDRQTFLFSATVDSKLDSLLEIALRRETMDQVVMIDTVGEKKVNLNPATQQRYCFAPYQSHVALVRRIINDHLFGRVELKDLKWSTSSLLLDLKPKSPGDNKIMVFLPTTRGAQLYAKVFASLSMGKELSVYEIHSAKGQRERTLTSRNFRKIQTPAVLFTSDVSARGVDYPGVGLVIQVGAPLSLDHYIHRIGRTGRGDLGEAGQVHGKGILILGELDQGFIEHQLKPSPLFSVVEQEHAYDDWESVLMGENLDRRFKGALTKVDEKLAKSAYTAFLGYNLTVGPRIGNTDRKRILEAADRYVEAFGISERPAVSTSFLERMGFMKHHVSAIESGESDAREPNSYELVDGTFPTINTRITKSPFASSSSSKRDDEDKQDLDEKSVEKENRMSRKERQEAFDKIGLGDTTGHIKINESEWEDFMEFKPGLPKLITKLHNPKRMGHTGNRPSKKISKIFSDNDGW